MTEHVLVTGGAGYIGSHTCLALLNAGYRVSVVDNLCNSKYAALERVQALTGRSLDFRRLDLLDREALEETLRELAPDAVIHFAGLKAVGESVERPLEYYRNNLGGAINLIQEMEGAGVRNLVFSSSATVYADPEQLPIPESAPLSVTNPYGRTKLIIEEMLRDLHAANAGWNIAILRYFNPVGAHDSGRIGEDPNGTPNNLMPLIARVAIGRLPELQVYGDDYATADGTGVRDYIHVCDLADGHIKALEKLDENAGLVTYNLGTGQGYSVLEMVAAFAAASGRAIDYRIAPRRKGDIAACYADPGLAQAQLGWRATRGLDDMCRDTWRWQSANPDGYPEASD